MTRRSPAQYDFARGLFDDLLLKDLIGPRRQTFPRRGKIRHIDIHHMIVRSTDNGGANRTCVDIWKSRPASAHYGVDKKYVAQFIYDNAEAWGNANARANQEGIVVEHANAKLAPGYEIDEETLETSAKLVARLHHIHKLGRPTSTGFGTGGTIRTHQSFFATACPGPYFRKHWTRYVKMVQAEYDRMKNGAPATPKPTTTRHFEHRHLNTWGDDGGKGTASFYDRIDDMVKDLVSGINPEVITLNEVKADQVPSWVKRLKAEGYDVVLAEAGNLVAVPAGAEVRKAQTKYLPANIQGEGRKEALGMVRAKINGHWEHVFVSHLDYRDGAKFDALRVKQAKWIASEAKRWSVVFVLKSWLTHTTIGIDENSNTWVLDKAFKPAGFQAAIKSGIDAIYGNRLTVSKRVIATKSDHPILASVYGKTV